MNRVKKVLITGATGFIGSHLTRRLLKEGYQIAIIKLVDDDAYRIKNLCGDIEIYNADLRNTQAMCECFSQSKPESVLHLATYYAVSHKPEEIETMVDTNVLGTVNLLEASKEFAVKLFVNTSSCFVYKESNKKLHEGADLSPFNLYALTKLHAEEACTYYAEKNGVKCVTFRIFPPYGPGDHERRLIPYVIKNLLDANEIKMTTGKQRWDFVYVEDIVDAYVKLLSVFGSFRAHEILNIGTGRAVSVRDVVLRIKDILSSQTEPQWGAIPHRDDEIYFMCADTRKTEEFLSWKAKTPIEEGLKHTIQWFRAFWDDGGT